MPYQNPSSFDQVRFFTTFKVIYFNADNNIIIPQANKGMPYRDPSSFKQVLGF